MVQLLGKEVGKIGYGLMGLTWRPNPVPQEQAFRAMKASLAHGANCWNGGEFYGTAERNSLHLLNEYFTKYPEDAEKIVLNIKGGAKPGQLVPDGSDENVARSIDTCVKLLDGKCKLDLFECARQDPNVPVEETVASIAKHVKAGKIGGIALSEVRAETIKRAVKVHPIAQVEVEFGLFATDILENGIADVCAENNIVIAAYSPLGRGFLTGEITSYESIPADSFLKDQPRFQPGAFDENIKLVHQVQEIAKNKGVTSAQIAIAWILAKSGSVHNGKTLPIIIPIPGATTEQRVKENSTAPELTEDEVAAIDKILANFTVVGARYGGPAAAHMNT